MKHVLLAMIASCSTLTAFQGLYVGGSLGGHLAEGAQQGNALGTFGLTPPGRNSYPIDLQQDLFDPNIAGMLYLGYGIGWRSLYLAAEGFVQFGCISLQSQNQSFHNQPPSFFRISALSTGTLNCCQGGIDILPGWAPNPATLLYGRVGVSAARTTLSVISTNSGADADVTNTATLSIATSQSRTAANFRAGAGLEQIFTRHLSLRSDYIYTDYGSLSTQGSATGLNPLGRSVSVADTAKLHIYDHAVLFGLNYRFCGQDRICLDPCCISSGYQGVYAGGSIGGGILTSMQNSSLVAKNSDIGLSQLATLPSQLYHDQFQGMVFLGCSKVWRKFYLAGELFAAGSSPYSITCTGHSRMIDPNNGTNYDTSSDFTVKAAACQYGLDLRPGVILTPLTLFYGRAGISAANLSTSYQGLSSGHFGVNPLWSVPDSGSNPVQKAAVRLGAGIEQILTSKLHLRADYIFTNFGFVSFQNTATGVDEITDELVAFNNKISSNLQNNAIVIGLSYYFH